MAGTVNKVILIGVLGRDPEMRYTPNGSAVASFSLATDEGYKDKQSGQKVDKTEWHRVEVFGKLAEISGEYLRKGSKVYVEGKLQTDEYEKDGIKRYSTKIKAFSMTMLSPKSEQQGTQQKLQNGQLANNWQQPAPLAPQQMPPMAQRAPQTPQNDFGDFHNDSIPF